MTRLNLVHWAATFSLVLWGAVVAQPFSGQVAGIYTTSSDFDFPVQLTLWPEEDGFAGDALIGAARYTVYAEQDGPVLRGIFEADGVLQRFALRPSISGPVSVQFSGEAQPISMTRAAFPPFLGRYEGAFGILTVRDRKGVLSARMTDSSNQTTEATGQLRGLRAIFPDISAAIYFDPSEQTYYIDTPGFFGPATRNEAPIKVGVDDTADFVRIGDALAAVPSGGTVELMPGTYSGPFEVTRPVVVRGKGNPGTVILTANDGEVVAWSAAGGALQNVTIKVPAAGVGLSVKDGDLTLEGATIEAAQNAIGVTATGTGNLVISDTDISGGDHALKIEDFGGPLAITGSSAASTQKSILSISGTPPDISISIADSAFSDSPSNAMRFDDVGTVSIDDARVSDVRVGLHHSGGASMRVSNSSFSKLGTHAMWFEGQYDSSIILSENKIEQVSQACVLFNNVTFPENGARLSGNRFSGCNQIAVAVVGDATDTTRAGLKLSAEEYYSNGTHLAVYAPVPLELDDARFIGSSGSGVILSDGSRLTAKSVSVDGSGEAGIIAVGDSIALALDDSVVENSTKSGIVTSGGVTLDMVGVSVSGNRGNGIELYQGTQVGRFEDNTVRNNEGSGVFVSGTLFTPGRSNDIRDNAEGDVVRR